MCSRICKHNYRITIIVKIGYRDHSPAGLVVTGVTLARDDMHSPRATGRPLSIHPVCIYRYKYLLSLRPNKLAYMLAYNVFRTGEIWFGLVKWPKSPVRMSGDGFQWVSYTGGGELKHFGEQMELFPWCRVFHVGLFSVAGSVFWRRYIIKTP